VPFRGELEFDIDLCEQKDLNVWSVSHREFYFKLTQKSCFSICCQTFASFPPIDQINKNDLYDKMPDQATYVTIHKILRASIYKNNVVYLTTSVRPHT
jgi:hypothetical protein